LGHADIKARREFKVRQELLQIPVLPDPKEIKAIKVIPAMLVSGLKYLQLLRPMRICPI
jgi:hypothetical protein